MKPYLTIQGPSKAPRKPCIAFRKYDGSNLRFEFSRKQGWHKFGTRKRLFDKTDPDFGSAIDIFMAQLAPALEEILKGKKYRDARTAIAFCEFFGKGSFAGLHRDDPKELRLIDINIHKRGIVSPRDFVDEFGHLPFAAEVVYEGNLNESLIQDVRDGKIPEPAHPGDVPEGIVCKGGSGHKLWMAKIKTDAYRQKLKETYQDRWEEYWE